MSEQAGEQERGLVAEEGVDEGSAASATEGLGGGAEQHAGAGVDLVGEPPRGAPDDEQAPAEPVDVERGGPRESREAAGSGQQLAAGEG